MANLTAANVVVLKNEELGGKALKSRIRKLVQVTLATQGGTTNLCPAAAFGFATIEDSSQFVKSDNSVILDTFPDYLQANLLFCAASTGVPTDQTGTFQGWITGYGGVTVAPGALN
jgi:hypothetical protein